LVCLGLLEQKSKKSTEYAGETDFFVKGELAL